MFGVRLGPWKYIEAEEEGRVELYDLGVDDSKTANVALENSAIVRDLAAALTSWRARDETLRRETPLELSEDVRRRLEALGYVP